MKLNPLEALGLGKGSKNARDDFENATLRTTPWRWRDTEGTYVGWNGDVWLYRTLYLSPLTWEDPGTRLMRGNSLHQIIVDLGATGRDLAGISLLSRKREFHLVAVTWEDFAEVPENSPPELAKYLEETLYFTVPSRTLFIGVKLFSSNMQAVGQKKSKGSSWTEAIKSVTDSALGEGVPNLASYEQDRNAVINILSKHGTSVPTNPQLRQLESWYNSGKGPDCEILEKRDQMYVSTGRGRDIIEMAAVMEFERPIFQAPYDQWILDAFSHTNSATVVSVRAVLESSRQARERSRKSQRKLRAQQEEYEASKDLSRIEESRSMDLAQMTEDYFATSSEPMITACSIVMARKDDGTEPETYIDSLRDFHGIEMKPLEHRQLAALEETLPCARQRVNPFLQDLSTGMISYAGIHAFSNLGDSTGVYMGLCDPDGVPVFLDPLGAPKANKPASMAVFGDTGSGKTYALQMLATQATLAGYPVIFINPKGYDTLSPFAEEVNGDVVKMSALEKEGGYFDPFRYAEPVMAAEIATEYILSVIGQEGLDQGQRAILGASLKRGANGGAKSVGAAMSLVTDEKIRKLVLDMMQSSATFSLGISMEPREPLGLKGGLTLIEFDRKLDLPEKGIDPRAFKDSQRIALAAVRLVFRASLEILHRAGGGVIILDEAWTVLTSSEGLAVLQQLGREARSLNVLPIFATQRVADLMRDGVDMQAYLSRVLCMKLTDPIEANAALTLCGLEPTAERISWLRDCGPTKLPDGTVRRALGIHSDLSGRHAALMVGPVPPRFHVAFTTNPEERKARDQARRNATQKQEE